MATKKKTTAKKKKKTAVKKKRRVSAAAKPKVTKNYLMMILDESGSMQSIQQQAINAFNEQVQTVKKFKNDMEVATSLIVFSDDARVWLDAVSLDKVPELGTGNYIPNGSTAMYDAVGKALETLQKKPDINDPNVTVLVLVISDGEENASKIYNSERISGMVSALTATGRWTFTYAGANQDLTKVAKKLNIPLGNMSTFKSTAGGMSANNALRVNSTRDLYVGYTLGSTQTNAFYNADNAGLKKQVKEDDTKTTP